MFPFSYTKKIVISTRGESKTSADRILKKFMEQLDNPKQESPDRITFDNFNIIYKRHAWLNKGAVRIIMEDDAITAELYLAFHTTPVLLLLVSALIIVLNWSHLEYALFGVGILWGFYSLLFLWTTVMVKATIRRIIKRRLFLAETGMEED